MTATETNNSPPRHPIQVVARRTGLSKDVIRAWEKRYAIVTPERHTSGRRLYSDRDIERLSLLFRVTRNGRRISDVSSLSDQDLATLLANEQATASFTAPPPELQTSGYEDFLQPVIDSINQLDEQGIYHHLANASMALPQMIFFEQVLSRALVYIGEAWKKGGLRIGHEHLATTQIRRFLLNLLERELSVGPALLVTTPVGQRHELGALMAAIIAAMEGWRVRYMGADMPATEIAAAAVATDARGILLSLVSRADDKLLRQEIDTLAASLPDDIFVVIGGRNAERYADFFAGMKAFFCSDLRSLSATLESL